MKNKFDLTHSWLEMISTAKTVYGFATLVAILFAMTCGSVAQADDVLIFYNSDSKLAISRHDGALITHNSELLAKRIKSINPELNVRLEPIASFQEVPNILSSVTDKIRGVVFVGHGNSDVYALNNQNRLGGSEMAELMQLLPREKVADRLTFYFLGCQMAKEGTNNFQRRFTERVMLQLPLDRRVGIDVIAHTSMSAYKSFNDPNFIHSASYKSGLGRWAEKITQNKGFVWPNLSFLMATSGAAAVSGMDHASMLQVGGAALAAVFAKAYLEGGISKYGTQLTSTTEVKQSIASLLRTSFQADQCQAVFKLRSL